MITTLSDCSKLLPTKNEASLIRELVQAAKLHLKQRKKISLSVLEKDLELIKIKASRKGIPYDAYINMLIHKDATSQWQRMN